MNLSCCIARESVHLLPVPPERLHVVSPGGVLCCQVLSAGALKRSISTDDGIVSSKCDSKHVLRFESDLAVEYSNLYDVSDSNRSTTVMFTHIANLKFLFTHHNQVCLKISYKYT